MADTVGTGIPTGQGVAGKMPAIGTNPAIKAQAFGSGTGIYGARQTNATNSVLAVAAGSDVYLPYGEFLVEVPASGSVIFTPDKGTTTITLLAASTVGYVLSDGMNFALRSAAGTVNFALTPIGL